MVVMTFCIRFLRLGRGDQDSDVVLLLAVIDEQSPRHLRFRHLIPLSILKRGALKRAVRGSCTCSLAARDQLEGAAQLLLRSARIVAVDGRKNEEVMVEYGVTRDTAACKCASDLS